MASNDITLTCTKCGKRHPVSNMRYNKAMILICKECYEKQKHETTKPGKRMTKSIDYKNYICAECRYKFKIRKDFPVKRCPFCGKSQIIENKNISAEDLLLDADNPKYDA